MSSYLRSDNQRIAVTGTDSGNSGRADEPRVEQILLAIGGRDEHRTDRLADVVRQIASPRYSTVTIVHIFDRDSYNETVKNVAETADDYIEPDELAAQMAIVREISEQLTAESIDCEVRATTGTKGEGAVEIATDIGADRVIIGGRQRSPTGKAIFGSLAQTVILRAPCPVTFVRDQ